MIAQGRTARTRSQWATEHTRTHGDIWHISPTLTLRGTIKEDQTTSSEANPFRHYWGQYSNACAFHSAVWIVRRALHVTVLKNSTFLYTNTHQDCGLEIDFFQHMPMWNKTKRRKYFFLTKFLRRYRCLSAGPGPEALIMSRFMELREFGDAATFLRKTNLEQLAAQSHAFDGTDRRPVCVLCENDIYFF